MRLRNQSHTCGGTERVANFQRSSTGQHPDFSGSRFPWSRKSVNSFSHSTAVKRKSSNCNLVPENGLAKTDARPVLGDSVSSVLSIHCCGSELPSSQALASTFQWPSAILRSCSRSFVHCPDFHS